MQMSYLICVYSVTTDHVGVQHLYLPLPSFMKIGHCIAERFTFLVDEQPPYIHPDHNENLSGPQLPCIGLAGGPQKHRLGPTVIVINFYRGSRSARTQNSGVYPGVYTPKMLFYQFFLAVKS